MLESGQARSILEKSFPAARIKSLQEVASQGHWACTLSFPGSLQDVVLRAFPPEQAWKSGKEKSVRELLSRTGLPVPKLLHHDRTGKIASPHYHIIERLPGQRLSDVFSDTEVGRKEIYSCLGDAFGKLHSVKLPEFGYIHSEEEKVSTRSDWWKKVFLVMCVDELLDLHHPEFRELAGHIRNHFADRQDSCGGKFEPCLLHHDTFNNSILLHRPEGEWTVSGITDFTTAFSGHNEFELSRIAYQILTDPDTGEYHPEARAFFKAYEKHTRISDRFEERRPYYTLYHLLSWVNRCTQDKQRAAASGMDVKESLDRFKTDIARILSR